MSKSIGNTVQQSSGLHIILEQAISIGDYTWVIMEGQVIETGESDLLKSPTNELVKQFVEGGYPPYDLS